MKSILKKFIPKSVLGFYHQTLAILANIFYGQPSEKMIIIGVTGTNGKSTTVMLIAKILEAAGNKVGATSTALFKIADREWLNDKKMTMLGRFFLQKMLREMVKAGCSHAVIEISSEGIKQSRHLGVYCDTLVFTNLTPEHLAAHGGLENYKKAKLKLFEKLARDHHKIINGEKIKKTIIVNGDDQYASEFLDFKVDEKKVFSLNKQYPISNIKYLVAGDIQFRVDGVSFTAGSTQFNLKLFGRFNVYNALAAIAAACSLGIDLPTRKVALEKVANLPGRMEFIENNKNFKVLVDYAPEPESLKQLYQTIKDHKLAAGKIIHLLGSCGGGRDRARRPILGRLAAENADFVVVANEDPYDDDPLEIINEVAEGALVAGKILNQNLFQILDRKTAIKKAVGLASAGDLVLLTGKGSEQAICAAHGKKIPWDEREVAREILKQVR